MIVAAISATRSASVMAACEVQYCVKFAVVVIVAAISATRSASVMAACVSIILCKVCCSSDSSSNICQ